MEEGITGISYGPLLPTVVIERLAGHIESNDVRPNLIMSLMVFPSTNPVSETIGVCMIYKRTTPQNSSVTEKKLAVCHFSAHSLNELSSSVMHAIARIIGDGKTIYQQVNLHNADGTYHWIALYM